MSVPKDRPPRPHSWMLFRSPLRQRAATKPMTVTSKNKAAKIMSAVQLIAFQLIIGIPPFAAAPMLPALHCAQAMADHRAVRRRWSLPVREIDDGGDGRAEGQPQQQIPIEERNAFDGGIGLVVACDPQQGDKRHQQQHQRCSRHCGFAHALLLCVREWWSAQHESTLCACSDNGWHIRGKHAARATGPLSAWMKG